ncbi:MAG: hypothetical protein BM485_11050 [Desulfobulbaceae bacterium DB1]|nr:MAG: hypothetical protein BM485_11050 [Desulfobulbaceae bacterium DB1]
MTKTQYSPQDDTASLSRSTPDITDRYDSDRLVLSLIMGMAALIGIWALLCMMAGILNLGGITELGASWFSAITGR